MGTHATEKIEAVNETNITITNTIPQGEILSVFKVLKPTL